MGFPVEKLRPWLIRWMYGVAAGHLLLALAMPWLVNSSLLDAYFNYLAQQFAAQHGQHDLRAVHAWWISLFGPTIAYMSILMAAVVYFGARYRNSMAWFWLALATLVWAPQDIWLSLQYNVWLHVYLDSLALLLILPPLACLWWLDRTITPATGNFVPCEKSDT